jgi:hypothetical protein
MNKLFYDHLINLQKIQSKLDTYGLSEKEKKELLRIVDATIHHEVMNVILSHLPRKHHEEFLEQFTHHPHDKKHLTYLQEKIEVNIEGKILSVVEEVIAAV